VISINQVNIVIDNDVLDKYHEFYFRKYPKRKVKPIDKPIPPSLNAFIGFVWHKVI